MSEKNREILGICALLLFMAIIFLLTGLFTGALEPVLVIPCVFAPKWIAETQAKFYTRSFGLSYLADNQSAYEVVIQAGVFRTPLQKAKKQRVWWIGAAITLWTARLLAIYLEWIPQQWLTSPMSVLWWMFWIASAIFVWHATYHLEMYRLLVRAIKTGSLYLGTNEKHPRYAHITTAR